MTTTIQREVARKLKNKTLLVTGGTGSFGKTIVKALLRFSPREVRVFSRSEDKQEKMRFQYPTIHNLKYILGDVRDKNQLDRAMCGVDIVFHAAAQKQVPATEEHILESIKTNVLGAQNVIDSCFRNDVKLAIAISTDKAVEPVNAMGMTKALQEKLFIAANLERHRGICKFSCVRYGNVLGSTGSVLEVFLKQLSAQQHLSITDMRMTRFLITLDQAVELVFIALVHTVGGEIFIPNIPAHKVIDLAGAVQHVYAPGGKTKISVVGIRPGEKIDETLISPTESLRTIVRSSHYVILPQIITNTIKANYRLPAKLSPYRFSSDTAKMLTSKQLEKIVEVHAKKSKIQTL